MAINLILKDYTQKKKTWSMKDPSQTHFKLIFPISKPNRVLAHPPPLTAATLPSGPKKSQMDLTESVMVGSFNNLVLVTISIFTRSDWTRDRGSWDLFGLNGGGATMEVGVGLGLSLAWFWFGENPFQTGLALIFRRSCVF